MSINVAVMHKLNQYWTYKEFIDPAGITCSGSGNVVFRLFASPLRVSHSVVAQSLLPDGHTKTTDVQDFGASASGKKKKKKKSKLLRKQSDFHRLAALCA